MKKTMRFASVGCFSALAVVATVRAQTPPSYRPEFLGTVASSTAINASGWIVGTTPLAPANERAWIAGPSSPVTPLPLPPGRMSSRANDINDAGVIAGVVSSASYADPSFGGIAALWIPNGSGGYTIQELGTLPGDLGSTASALNDVGDVVGYSQGSMYRRAVLFTSPSGIQDLTPTGAFDPQDVNDQRVVVCYSTHASRLDLSTMILQDLGVPAGGSWWSSSGIAINAANQVAGLAILATSTSCDREAARYTDGIGWQVFSGCGPINGCGSINDFGDVTMWVNVAAYVRFEGIGSYRIEDLIVAPVGHWYLFTGTGRINDARQIVVAGSNAATGESGLLLLTPIVTAGTGVCFGDGSGTACPCANESPTGSESGCLHSLGSGGKLAANGVPSLTTDTITLIGTQMPDSSVLYFQGTTPAAGGAGTPFGDGLRCAVGSVVRLGTKTNVQHASQYPSAGDPSVSAAGTVTVPGVRTYQCWYRNADPAFCTASTFNLTNGLTLTWSP
jgi:hypothetical protein